MDRFSGPRVRWRMPRSKLPVLRHRDDLKIPAPCAEDFDEMTPAGPGRMCDRCCSVVHDMSAMTERAAARFLAARRGQPTCVHFEFHPDGAIRYRREPARPLAPVMAVALAACTPHGPPRELSVDGADPQPIAAPVLTPTVVPVATPPAVKQAEPPDVEPCKPKGAALEPGKRRPAASKKKKDLDMIDGMIEW